MKIHTITLNIEIPDEMYDRLQEAFYEQDRDGTYNKDFDDYMHDLVDFRILRHILGNMDLMSDLKNHFCNLIQT